MDGASDPSVLGGSGGSSGSEATAGSDSAGSFNQSGSSTGGTDGTPTGGTFTTSGQAFGGQLTGGTFGTAGTTTGGGGAGGAAAGAGGKAGAGGTGGTPPNGTCAENPVTAKTMWEATALPVVTSGCADSMTSDYCGPAERAHDDMPSTRFSTGRARMGDEYYQIDFGDTVTVSRVVLNTAAGSGDYTLGYEIRMADTEGAVAGSAVIIAGAGMQGTTTINFPSPKTGRFLRIDQTETMAGWWSLTEIDVSCQ